MEEHVELYLKQYLELLSETERKKYQSFSADYFCGDEHNANLCADLICIGQKTATCSLKYSYESCNENIPIIGHLQVVLDWSGKPVCIIEIESVEECKYSNVSEDFAYLEGEGDRSLKWWKKSHWDFFTQECKEVNIEPSEDMILILEKFKVIYKSEI
ncbi:MAG: ASCH domain-containing protein [Campylobacteraceae bacterium]|nr:ASCH domain-containing protein [Campylobacteraceae bacterium]